jgi:iron(III) transport system substrate-binding protein
MRIDSILRVTAAVTTGVFAAGLFAGAALAKTDLLVYTSVEADELKGFKKAIEADIPDINIKWVRDSTGIMTAKLLAEKGNPKAHIVWGIAATSLVLLANEGYFQGYAPKGLDKLDKKMYDPKNNPPQWIGQRSYMAGVCYNTVEGKKHNLPVPKSWKDLTKPVYAGHVVMPNPNSSGTGFLDVSSWLQTFGEDGGWSFMDALHKNIAWYTHSGSKPCKQSASGEIPIGVSFMYRGVNSMNKGAPLVVVAPSEGLGWELESFGIVRGVSGDVLAAAKKMADWSVTKKANVMYNVGYAVVAMPGVAKEVKGFPPEAVDLLINNDFAWAAANRKAILKKWAGRYDTKSLPKKK